MQIGSSVHWTKSDSRFEKSFPGNNTKHKPTRQKSMRKTPTANSIIHFIRAGVFLALVSACSLHVAQAADQKLASVDLNKVFISLPMTKKAESEMLAARAAARAELDRKKEATLKTPETDKQIAEWSKGKETELQKKFESLRQPILDTIIKAVKTVQAREGYSFIIDTSAVMTSRAPVAFAGTNTPDITDLVIQEASKSSEVSSAPVDPSTVRARIPVEITSEGPSEFKDGIAYARDNVVIKFMGMQIKADRIEYDPESRNVRFYGQENKDSEWKLIANLKFEG